ncbi:MAG: c-type cytochrome [Trichloromonas sp.]|nr:c-type cytochrome [Trichloromonas sp.]
MRAIHGGKPKNDKIDSHKIAVLLRGGSFSLTCAYAKEMRATRDLLRRRNHLPRKLGKLFAHIQNTATQYNLLEPLGADCETERTGGFAEKFPDPVVRRIGEVDLLTIEREDEGSNRSFKLTFVEAMIGFNHYYCFTKSYKNMFFDLLFLLFIVYCSLFRDITFIIGTLVIMKPKKILSHHRLCLWRAASGGLFLFLFLFFGCQESSAPEARGEKTAAQQFASWCSPCHGKRGESGLTYKGPSLQGPDFIYGGDPDSLRTSIRDGRPNGMPAFGKRFSPTQIDELTVYLKSLQTTGS